MSDAALMLRKGIAPVSEFLARLDDATRAAILAELVGREDTWWTIESGNTRRGDPFLIPSSVRHLRKDAISGAVNDFLGDAHGCHRWPELVEQGYRVVKIRVRRAT